MKATLKPRNFQPIKIELSPLTTNFEAFEPLVLQRLRRLGKAVGILEGWLSVFFTAVVTLFGCIGPIALAYWNLHEPLQNASMLFWTICWFTLDLPYQIRLFITAIRNRRPVAYHAAVESRMPPILLRPIVAFWWLIHFAIGALSEATLHISGSRNSDDRFNDIFLAFGMGMAANGYLMLAVCAATKSTTVRKWVWRFRLAIDLALGFTAALFVHL